MNEMNANAVEAALTALGRKLDPACRAEIVIVGGAAALITGLLPPSFTTGDCDVMEYKPSDIMGRVELAAEQVASELGLNDDWFNSHVQALAVMPDGWRQRLVFNGEYGPLRVWCASRIDIIALKALAHRDVDFDALNEMQIRRDEAAFAKNYLQQLIAQNIRVNDAEIALAWIDAQEFEE